MEKDILSIACPSCGAPAEFDIVRQIYRCGSCGGTVKLETAKQEKEQLRMEIRRKVSEAADRFPLMTTTCTGCGATLVFEENEAVSSCDFCGRKLVRKKYTQGEYVPEGIIPFAVTPEEAKQALREWCGQNNRRREAKALLGKLEKLKGYYLPYQMVRGPVHCEVRHKNDSAVFTAGGYLQDEFINCSAQLDNLVLDAMEPYDLSELRAFDYAYVAGQRVKITDISAEETKSRLRHEVDSNYRIFLEKIWGTKAIELETTEETVFRVPVLLPVYYIQDGTFSAAVNGQTGKVSVRAEKRSCYVSLPWWLEAVGLFLLTCAAVLGIGWLAWGDLSEALPITVVLALFYLLIFCAMFEPGLSNRGSITYYRDIFTSGEQTFRREKGKLVPRDTVLKRRIAEPVFLKKLHGKDTQVTYVFRSRRRILSMVALGIGAIFLPVILALFVNGFDFGRIKLGGSAVWFCIAVPVVPVMLIQLGLKQLYSDPWVYTFTETGRKKRWRAGSSRSVKDRILTVLAVCVHPLSWVVLGCLAVMVYLTAFGF